MEVIEVSNPTCARVGGYTTSGRALRVAALDERFYVADGEKGLVILSSLPNLQCTLRVNAAPEMPFTIETSANPFDSNPWTPLFTTNAPAMAFDFVDFDGYTPQKYYRVRQPWPHREPKYALAIASTSL